MTLGAILAAGVGVGEGAAAGDCAPVAQLPITNAHRIAIATEAGVRA
jgi:hypothetical protein